MEALAKFMRKTMKRRYRGNIRKFQRKTLAGKYMDQHTNNNLVLFGSSNSHFILITISYNTFICDRINNTKK